MKHLFLDLLFYLTSYVFNALKLLVER